MKTTEEQIGRPVRVDEPNRFDVAGRLLALAEILRDSERAEGPEAGGRSSTVLRALAEAVSLYGIEYGQGWIQGFWHGQGVRVHETWVAARSLLEGREDPRTPLLG